MSEAGRVSAVNWSREPAMERMLGGDRQWASVGSPPDSLILVRVTADTRQASATYVPMSLWSCRIPARSSAWSINPSPDVSISS